MVQIGQQLVHIMDNSWSSGSILWTTVDPYWTTVGPYYGQQLVHIGQQLEINLARKQLWVA